MIRTVIQTYLYHGFLLGGLTFACQKAVASSCPKSTNDWHHWHEKTMKKIRQSGYSDGFGGIVHKLKYCSLTASLPKKAGACLENLKHFATQQYTQKKADHSLGLVISDKEYFATFPHKSMSRLPPFLVNNEFLEYLEKGQSGIRNGIDYIAKINKSRPNVKKVIAFYYQSQHLPSVDDSNSFGRFFVFVPGDFFDRFIQFTVADPDSVSPSNSISQIIVVKKVGEKILNQPKVYFNDFWRKRKESAFIITTRLEETGRLENCYSCHKNPLIPIVPKSESFDWRASRKDLITVNGIMTHYANGSIVGIKHQHFGPGLGAKTEKHKNSAFEGCLRRIDLSEEERLLLIEAGQCHQCHNGIQLGSLNFPSGFTQLFGKESLVETFVVKFGLMPPGHNLDGRQRKILYSCLLVDYIGYDNKPGRLEEWLYDPKCYDEDKL